jgi:hypothetical protein
VRVQFLLEFGIAIAEGAQEVDSRPVCMLFECARALEHKVIPRAVKAIMGFQVIFKVSIRRESVVADSAAYNTVGVERLA